jgi:hypothetical protein
VIVRKPGSQEPEGLLMETSYRPIFETLGANPLAVDPMTIKDIKVVQTFKDGTSIYQMK